MTDQKLNLNEVRYLGVSDITYCKLEFITKKFKTMNLIWRAERTKINRFGWNSVHGGAAVANTKAREILVS